MADVNIIRKQTEEEKQDFIEIGSKDFRHIFRQKIIDKQQEYTKAHKPYCYRCAKIDFEDKVDEILREALRKKMDVSSEELIKFDVKNLDEYGKPDRFKEVGKKEALDRPRGSNISGYQVLIGFNVDYVCKKRGCGVTCFRPLEEEKKK